CVPSKPLLRPVVAIADARRVEGARKAVEGPLDASAVFARRDGFVFHLARRPKCRLGEGHGCRPGRRPWAAGRSPAGGRRGSQRRAGGGLRPARGGRLHRQPRGAARPARHRQVRPWISRDATSASTVPERLAIVGSGGVGTEMASAYQGLGTSVTLLVPGERRLARMRTLVAQLDPRPAWES